MKKRKKMSQTSMKRKKGTKGIVTDVPNQKQVLF